MSHQLAPPSGGLRPDQAERIAGFAASVRNFRDELARRIVGQETVVTLVLAAVLAEGHCLLVGVPGLAKTLLVSSLAELLGISFKRIQFTPDLMPSDITGATMIRAGRSGERDFQFLEGPIFSNVILADEINRTPPKTQAALMEAMEERQISVAGKLKPLPRPFFVLATQNPIEQEGTYPLPVSQLDRFLFNITIDYPSTEEEYRMLLMTTSTYSARLESLFERESLVELLDVARQIKVSDELVAYAAQIARSSRPASSGAPPFVRENVAWGAGPRATHALIAGARAFALMDGRDHIRAEDVRAVAVPTLRHRIVLRHHAQAEGISTADVVQGILDALAGGAAPVARTPVA